HGGRTLAFAREHNIDYCDILDFSANINPLGPSPKALDAIRQTLDSVRVYPEEMTAGLTRQLSGRIRVPSHTIRQVNDTSELLYFWRPGFRPGTPTLIVPTCSEYRKALESVGAEIHTICLEPSNPFRLPPVTTNAETVIVTNPNNPTGAYVPPEEMI